ncbi:hypothetical protein [Nitrosomonas communis]|uniref:hypothetical protein n=1 Tax=Nitrosomonas communis TaxID=44574 RepID=UPI0026E92FC4|nr:hypothetical protein [Nitrosomonas communis]MCO6426513.1 hypothetical protein [Nitrosomonas communis]
MPRTHGYTPIGKRCHSVCNWHARGRVNVIGAFIGECLLTVGLFKSKSENNKTKPLSISLKLNHFM